MNDISETLEKDYEFFEPTNGSSSEKQPLDMNVEIEDNKNLDVQHNKIPALFEENSSASY